MPIIILRCRKKASDIHLAAMWKNSSSYFYIHSKLYLWVSQKIQLASFEFLTSEDITFVFIPNDTVICVVSLRWVSKVIKLPREHLSVAWIEVFVSLGCIIKKKLELERQPCVSITVWLQCRYLLSYIAFRSIARGNV